MRIPNSLLDLSHAEFLVVLRRLPKPKFVRISNEANYDSRDLPRFNLAFDEICEQLGRIPTQEEYGDYYVSLVKDFCEEYNIPEEQMRLRAQRNYPSFLREYQLLFLLREAFPKSTVVLDEIWDNKGVDIVITGPTGLSFGVCSCVSTNFSDSMNKRKDAGSRSYVKLPLMKLPINASNASVINNYWCYNRSHVDEIKSFIIETFKVA